MLNSWPFWPGEWAVAEEKWRSMQDPGRTQDPGSIDPGNCEPERPEMNLTLSLGLLGPLGISGALSCLFPSSRGQRESTASAQ